MGPISLVMPGCRKLFADCNGMTIPVPAMFTNSGRAPYALILFSPMMSKELSTCDLMLQNNMILLEYYNLVLGRAINLLVHETAHYLAHCPFGICRGWERGSPLWVVYVNLFEIGTTDEFRAFEDIWVDPRLPFHKFITETHKA